MRRLLLLDEQNYDENMPEILRVAVRGIIFRDGKLLLIEDKLGELKLPGGGKEGEEDDLQTLIREVAEETGLHVIPDTVRPFGFVEEKRLSTHEPAIWHQISHIYFCDVGKEQEQCNYSENEINNGMHFTECTLDEAIQTNKRMLSVKGQMAWNKREYNTLLLIKDHLNKNN